MGLQKAADVAPIMQPIVDCLILARYNSRLTQRELAEKAGCRQSQLASWERLAMIPTVDCLARWAGALGYDVALIEQETPEETR